MTEIHDGKQSVETYLLKKLEEDKSSAGRVGASGGYASERRIEAKRVVGRPARILGFDTT